MYLCITVFIKAIYFNTKTLLKRQSIIKINIYIHIANY